MSEPMTVYPEVWPVAADEHGLWLLSGMGPWRPALPVMADGDVHAEVELELMAHGLTLSEDPDVTEVPLLHSTSWRPDGPSIVLTYIAVVRRAGAIRENWPAAEPISPLLPGAVGKPPAHEAAAPPVPRFVDCLLHALRHVAYLRDTDSKARRALDANWLRHLDGLRPALAGMYLDD